jgi:Phage integrase, N-terminal SAM-like domain
MALCTTECAYYTQTHGLVVRNSFYARSRQEAYQRPPPGPRVDFWWRLHGEPNLERTTRESYADLYDRHILPRLGTVALRDLTPERIEQFAGDLRAIRKPAPRRQRAIRPLEPVSVERIRAALPCRPAARRRDARLGPRIRGTPTRGSARPPLGGRWRQDDPGREGTRPRRDEGHEEPAHPGGRPSRPAGARPPGVPARVGPTATADASVPASPSRWPVE